MTHHPYSLVHKTSTSLDSEDILDDFHGIRDVVKEVNVLQGTELLASNLKRPQDAARQSVHRTDNSTTSSIQLSSQVTSKLSDNNGNQSIMLYFV